MKPTLTRDGTFTVESGPILQVPLAQLFPAALPLHTAESDWRFALDKQATAPSSFTTFKTTSRDAYDAARARLKIVGYTKKKEVLLWNELEEIMEGSMTSVFVWRGEEEGWYTPAAASGGQQGTVRRWALETGRVREGVVKRDELPEGSWIAIGNGVRGFWGGRITHTLR